MCVLDCPLADGAGTALTFHQRGKPLPKTEYTRKTAPSLINVPDSPSYIRYHCFWGSFKEALRLSEAPGMM